ncbi:MAG: serine hydrolase domain-containing protein [Pseudomonadota bacterium]
MKRLVLMLCFPLTVMAAPGGTAKLAQSLDTIIAARFKPELPGVAALIVKDGRPILRKAYGLANVELNVPLRPEHVFRIGSTTKLFTATAVMLLVEEGKLSLDAPITRYISGAPRHWEAVTIEHLLIHTSGIPNLSMDSGYWRTTARIDHTLEELIAPVRARPLDFVPGTKFAYNNTGFNLLGMVIEKVSGIDYFAFVDQRIVKPLGLKYTRESNDKQLIPGLVTGYRNGPTPAWPLANSNLHAAGGLVSTVDDLATFMLSLQGGKIVPPASVKRMNTSYVLPSGVATGYGLGTWVRTVNGKRLVGHGGYIFNFYSQLEMDIDSGIVAVTLHNGDKFGGDNEELSRQLISAVQGSAGGI